MIDIETLFNAGRIIEAHGKKWMVIRSSGVGGYEAVQVQEDGKTVELPALVHVVVPQQRKD